MTTLEATGIASESFDSQHRFAGLYHSIATESAPALSSEWDDCADALLRTWKAPSAYDDGLITPPAQCAIEAAIDWLEYLRRKAPSVPPTLIVCEPAGGIIVKRRFQSQDGSDHIWELTFYNDGTAEFTKFLNGRVIEMHNAPFRPSS